MPELPEVETVRRGLMPVLEGRTLTRVVVRRADLRIPFPPGFADRLTGRRVVRLARRAKYILAHLDTGEVLLVHLGMSGRFSVGGAVQGQFTHATPLPEDGLGAHDHVIFETDRGQRIVYTDHRRFGLMTLLDASETATHRLLRDIGPEPLSEAFSGAYLHAAFKGRGSPVKSALLDQRVVAGLGNIYVCEALFGAGIAPRRKAGTLKAAACAALVDQVRLVLEAAITAGGSSLRDFRDADGAQGYFQHQFSVYGRAGEACIRSGCGGHVERIVQAGRSTFFCRSCQR